MKIHKDVSSILPLSLYHSTALPPDLWFYFLCSLFQNKLAKALYDNTAECVDELAFRKGDIVTVMHQNVAGTSGWWMCSLYGRHGLAPANRLQLLSQTTTATNSSHITGKHKLIDAKNEDSAQNIYQIPSVPRPSSSQTYECMDMIYKVPSSPLSASKSPVPSTLKHGKDGPEVSKKLFSSNMIECMCRKAKTQDLHTVDVRLRSTLVLFLGKCSLMIRDVKCCRNATL